MTPKELAEEAADKSWGIAESGKGMMQDAVEAALSAFAKAHAEEFRRLAAEARTCIDDTHPWEAEPASRAWAERAETWDEAAQMLEEKLNG